MPVKKCEVCGSEFSARLNKIRTCGIRCRNTLISKEKSKKYQTTKQCVVCSAEFQVGAADAKRATCSDACGYVLRGRKTSRSVECECATCGKSFLVQRSQLSGVPGGGSYCSKKCLYERNSAKTARACVCCGQVFTSPPSQMHVKTCSMECGYKWFSADKKPNYVGATKRVTRPDGTVAVVTQRWYASKKNTARRIAQDRATPPWVDFEAIRKIYETAAKLEELTGQRYHVDHIVPLNGKTVSGLHNQFNLTPIPAFDNMSKGNRHWPDKP